MSVCCESCVLSGRGLCDELITRTEEPYRLWWVVCDLETTWMRRTWPTEGCCAQRKKRNWNIIKIIILRLGQSKLFVRRDHMADLARVRHVRLINALDIWAKGLIGVGFSLFETHKWSIRNFIFSSVDGVAEFGKVVAGRKNGHL